MASSGQTRNLKYSTDEAYKKFEDPNLRVTTIANNADFKKFARDLIQIPYFKELLSPKQLKSGVVRSVQPLAQRTKDDSEFLENYRSVLAAHGFAFFLEQTPSKGLQTRYYIIPPKSQWFHEHEAHIQADMLYWNGLRRAEDSRRDESDGDDGDDGDSISFDDFSDEVQQHIREANDTTELQSEMQALRQEVAELKAHNAELLEAGRKVTKALDAQKDEYRILQDHYVKKTRAKDEEEEQDRGEPKSLRREGSFHSVSDGDEGMEIETSPPVDADPSAAPTATGGGWNPLNWMFRGRTSAPPNGSEAAAVQAELDRLQKYREMLGEYVPSKEVLDVKERVLKDQQASKFQAQHGYNPSINWYGEPTPWDTIIHTLDSFDMSYPEPFKTTIDPWNMEQLVLIDPFL